MASEAAGSQARSGSWRAWVHLGVLVLLAGALDTAAVLSVDSDVSLGGAVAHLPDFYFGTLPVLVAISCGMLAFGVGTVRQATLLVVSTTGVMLLFDLLGGHGAPGTATMAVRAGMVQSSGGADFTSAPLLGTVWRFLHGDLSFPLPRARRYDPGAPLLVTTFAVLKAAHLLLPAALVGTVLGVQAWVADHVSFRRPVDERVGRLVLAWVFAPAAYFLVLQWERQLLAEVFFAGTVLLAPVLPTAVFLAIGAVGWATARRVAQWSS